MQLCLRLSISVLILAASALPVSGNASESADEDQADRRYIFSWPFIDTDNMDPRGGTTEGPDVLVLDEASDAWVALQAAGPGKKERDRRAILAMAGPYRASFDFLETVGFSAGFEPDKPYRSWGTEYVYVVVDKPDFISLQHIMVMVFELDDGTLSEPMVVKHWRQDWRYEDRDLHVFSGDRTWRRVMLKPDDVEGRWSQTVYQVDDSPRYESIGAWEHSDDYSIWESDETWRPLPRREFSVRDDYDVLIGTNRHTILPTGWVHEEDNLKVALDTSEMPATRTETIARETGVNRYQRIVDYDWSAGDEYWQRTAPFWREVRDAWAEIYRDNDSFPIRPSVDGQPLFMTMFRLADETTEGDFDRDAARAEIDAVLTAFLAK